MTKRQVDRPPEGSRDSTADLVSKVRGGDRSAENEIVRRNLPALRQWARGRLPAPARSRNDTDDLVQETILHVLKRLGGFDASQPGGLQRYLRTSLRNRVCDEVRHAIRYPCAGPVHDAPDRGPTPHEAMAQREAIARYRRALGMLRPTHAALVQAYIEREWSYTQIAHMLDKPSANAARVAVGRAIKRLLEVMRRDPMTVPPRLARQTPRPRP